MLNPDWYEAIDRRISRRRYTDEPVAPDLARQLDEFCRGFRPFPAARAVFVEKTPDGLFTGLVGSYGSVVGARSAALFAGTQGSEMDVGYVGEAFILEATRLGLDTCWLAGAFSRKRAASLHELSPGERVPAIAAVGIAEEKQSFSERSTRSFVGASKRLPLAEIAPGASPGAWPDWAFAAVDAANKAPSGGNKQPWRFRLEDGALVLSCAEHPYPTAKLDLGIAMIHVELGAEHAGVEGSWEKLDGTDVAQYVPR